MLVNSLETKDHLAHLQQTFSTFRKYNMKLNLAKCLFWVSSGKFMGYIVTHHGIKANLKKIRANHVIPSPKSLNDIHKLTRRMTQRTNIVTLFGSIRECSVSSWFVRRKQKYPMYYISKSLHDAETRYSYLEKLALTIVIAAIKLCPYFQAHQIVVVTSLSIKYIPHKPKISGRLAKWAAELKEYDMVFRPDTAIKSQVRADFMAEFSLDILPAVEQ